MTINKVTSIEVERALERMRQERETFDQRKAHENRWFILRLVMGYSAVFLLGTVCVVSAIILFNNKSFPDNVVIAAGAALFVDILGLLISVWKIALNPEFMTKLKPVTELESNS